MKKECIIIGAGTYGQVYASYLKDDYSIIAYYDDNMALIGHSILGIPVKGNIADAISLIKQDNTICVFIPIGNNPIRQKLVKQFATRGANLPSYIHPSTQIHESVKIGVGVYILPGCNIMPLTTIGDYTMVSMGVNIAHHTNIGKFCFFSQGCNVGASIIVEDFAYCGISSTLMTGVKNIGKNSLIGAGAVVIKDVPANTVVAGVPARILKEKPLEDQM